MTQPQDLEEKTLNEMLISENLSGSIQEILTHRIYKAALSMYTNAAINHIATERGKGYKPTNEEIEIVKKQLVYATLTSKKV